MTAEPADRTALLGQPLRVTILGCGTSAGVPVLGFGWGKCDPDHPRNHRLRTSAYVQWGDLAILIDFSPDLRRQWLDNRLDRLTHVLVTHEHADHTHGIDDLRFIAWHNGPPIPLYADPKTLAILHERFGYVFAAENKQTEAIYQPFLAPHSLNPGDLLDFAPITTLAMDHATTMATGYRFGSFAYCLDVHRLDEAALATLEGVDTWVVDCVGQRPHPSHAHLEQVLDWVERLKPRRTVLSSLSTGIDYRTWTEEVLPTGLELAYDGMVIEVAP